MESFDQFSERASELFKISPSKFRFTYKYRHVDGKLVLKATDDNIVIKFETDQVQDLKKMEKLNRSLIFTMLDAPMPELQETTQVAAANTNTNATNTTQQNTSGSKKKSKKKGKK